MQSIVYVPPGGRYEDPATRVEFTLVPPYIIGSVSGTGAADTTVLSSSIPGIDGVYVHGVRAESREVSFFIHVDGESRRDMYRRRFELANMLAPRDQPGMLYYSNDYHTKRIAAIPVRSPNFTDRLQNYNKAEIAFLCPFPYWENLSEKSGYMAYLYDGFEFPFSFDPSISFAALANQALLQNEGSLPTPVVITITGPATNPGVLNETTGEKLRLLKPLEAGQTLTISTKRGNKSVIISQSDGTTEDAFQYIDPESVFFSLMPGDNVLKYMSDNESESTMVVVTYRELYAGV